VISSDQRDAGEPLDPPREDAWMREAKDRLGLYDAGLMEAFDAENVLMEFADLGDDSIPDLSSERLP
jgi:hypothetical protein